MLQMYGIIVAEVLGYNIVAGLQLLTIEFHMFHMFHMCMLAAFGSIWQHLAASGSIWKLNITQ